MLEQFLSQLPAIASTVGLAFFSFWGSIPAGLALGLSPLTVILASTTGYAAGVGLITLAGGRVRERLLKRLGDKAKLNPESRFARIWERYGMIGLGAAAPLTLGAQIGAAVGMALNAPPRRLFVIMTGCALVWSVILTALVLLGAAGVQSVTTP